MLMTKKAPTTHLQEKRNLGVTVIAGVIAAFAGLIAIDFLPLYLSDFNTIIYFSVAVLLGLLALAVAIHGRMSTLKSFLKGLMHYQV